MNEKQIKFRDACKTVKLQKHISWQGSFLYVDSNDYCDMRDYAMELLADEPEKSLRDYTLAELAELVHDMAKEKGWWDAPREWPEIACLIHSEISEAVECYRNGEMALHVVDGKPEGLVVELADVVIRCLDYWAHLKGQAQPVLSLTVAKAVVEGRPPYSGTMLDFFYSMHWSLNDSKIAFDERLIVCMQWVFDTAKRFSLNLHAAIEAKIEYNATRPYRHGGKKA